MIFLHWLYIVVAVGHIKNGDKYIVIMSVSAPGVVISFSSVEKPFIDKVLTECKKFASDIVVSYGSHLYDGTVEDIAYMNELRQKYTGVKFVEYEVDISLPVDKRQGVVHRPTAYFHNMSRWVAVCALNEKTEWVYVIDADEIPDGDALAKWWVSDVPKYRLGENVAFKWANYWYFKAPQFRARTLEDSVLLIHRKHLTRTNIFGDFERDHLIRVSGCALDRQVRGVDGGVCWHHMSWVRTPDGLRHKVSHWAHANDIFKGADVDAIMAHIYSDPNKANDIVHRYEYDVVDNRFGIVV